MPIFVIQMFRTALISIMCLLSVVPALRLGIIYGCYELNKEHITNTYCVNINEPVLMCSGTCYVNDIIAESSAEDGAQAPLPAVEDLRPIIPFFTEGLCCTATIAVRDRQPLPAIFTENLHHRLYADSIFKPPRF